MMKIRLLLAVLGMAFMCSISANAAERFDYKYYGDKYPDVVSVYGYNEDELYKHYSKYGKYEGRLAFDGDIPMVPLPIEQSGSIESDILNIAVEQVNSVPYIVLERFKELSWRFILTDENIAKTELEGRYLLVNAVTSFDGSYIKVSNRRTAASTATAHEFGHFLYYIAGRFDDDNEVNTAYLKEKDNRGFALSGGNGLSDCVEFYAEVFYNYCSDKEAACRLYPITCAIIEHDLNYIR